MIGYYAFDGLLQLSLRPSILAQKFLQVADLQVGEIVKGTIKRLGDTGLVVTISGNLTGIVWPNHYADITLKHPEKRFKVGGKIKCRVRYDWSFPPGFCGLIGALGSDRRPGTQPHSADGEEEPRRLRLAHHFVPQRRFYRPRHAGCHHESDREKADC